MWNTRACALCLEEQLLKRLVRTTQMVYDRAKLRHTRGSVWRERQCEKNIVAIPFTIIPAGMASVAHLSSDKEPGGGGRAKGMFIARTKGDLCYRKASRLACSGVFEGSVDEARALADMTKNASPSRVCTTRLAPQDVPIYQVPRVRLLLILILQRCSSHATRERNKSPGSSEAVWTRPIRQANLSGSKKYLPPLWMWQKLQPSPPQWLIKNPTPPESPICRLEKKNMHSLGLKATHSSALPLVHHRTR